LKFISDNRSFAPGHVPVALKVIDDYGHLDTLIGNDAAQDVFRFAAEFFGAPAPTTTAIRPKGSTAAFTTVVTGPVISHPRVIEGRHYLTLWSETNEFQASDTENVSYIVPQNVTSTDDGSLPKKDGQWLRSGAAPDQHVEQGPNKLKNSMFWLGEFQCDTVKGEVVPKVTPGKGGLLNLVIPHLHLPVISNPFLGAVRTPNTGTGAPGSFLSARGTLNPSFRLPAELQPEDPDGMNWGPLPWFKRFMSGQGDGGLALIVGSCWYPGSWFDQDRADRVFGPIRTHVEEGRGIDLLLLVGDQIYADASYAIFDIAENRERYQESYRHAWRSPQARWVFRHVPTYFAIDDHEFRDNYPTAQFSDNDPCHPNALVDLAKSAAQEAWNFQMHHGVLPGTNDLTDNRLWYGFQSGDFDFFVFDTRSERNYDLTGLRRIIGDVQRDGFINWVQQLKSPPRPLFIVTGSPLAPIPTDELLDANFASSEDSLRGFPEFVEWVGKQLSAQGRHRSVIWLSGDPHFSSMSQYQVTRKSTGELLLDCVAIVSSGVNVPLPFANDYPGNTTWTGPFAPFEPVGVDLRLQQSSCRVLSTARAHVLRLDLLPWQKGWMLNIGVVNADNPAPVPYSVELPS
jgi:PhoD-like phosphatase